MAVDTDATNFELRLALDLGSSKTACGAQLAVVGEDPDPAKTVIVELEDGHRCVPSIMGFVRRGDSFLFRWGHDFRKRLRDGSLVGVEHFVFENVKVCLIPSPWQHERRQTVQQELDRLASARGSRDQLTPQWLLECYLSQIRKTVDRQIRKVYPARLREQLTGAQRRWTLMVPEQAAGPPTKVFSDMAPRAGFPNVTLVSEAETAAAFRLREYVLQTPAVSDIFEHNDHVVSVDGGDLSLDIQAFSMSQLIEADVSRTRLNPVGRNGTLHGSSCIFERFWEDVVAKSGDNLTAICEKLGMSRSQLRFYLVSYFDVFKADYPNNPPYSRIAAGDRRMGTFHEFDIDPDKMDIWFAELLKNTINGIQEVVTPGRTKLILLSGGCFHNKWLVEKVKEEFQHRQGIAVPRCGRDAIGPSSLNNIWGALTRGGASHQHTSVDPQEWVTIGILLDEEYDPTVHVDIRNDKQSIRKACVWEDGMWKAPDRFHVVVPYGSLRDGVVHDGKIQSTFGVNPKAKCKGLDCPDSSCVKCPRIKLELLRVAQPMEDHAAVWKRDDGKLCTMRRPQIQGLSNTIEVVSWKWLVKPVNRRKLQKYRRFRERKGAPVKHEVTATLIVDSRDADSGMKWEFAPPDYRWLQSGEVPPPETTNALGFADDIIHQKSFSRFLQRNPEPAYEANQPRSSPMASSSSRAAEQQMPRLPTQKRRQAAKSVKEHVSHPVILATDEGPSMTTGRDHEEYDQEATSEDDYPTIDTIQQQQGTRVAQAAALTEASREEDLYNVTDGEGPEWRPAKIRKSGRKSTPSSQSPAQGPSPLQRSQGKATHGKRR